MGGLLLLDLPPPGREDRRPEGLAARSSSTIKSDLENLLLYRNLSEKRDRKKYFLYFHMVQDLHFLACKYVYILSQSLTKIISNGRVQGCSLSSMQFRLS